MKSRRCFRLRVPDSEAEVKLEFEKGDNVTINESCQPEGTVDEVLPNVASSVCWSLCCQAPVNWYWQLPKQSERRKETFGPVRSS